MAATEVSPVVYYRIGVLPSLGFGRLQLERRFRALVPGLLDGVVIDPNEVPTPWSFTIEPNPGLALAMNDYYPNFHLMSKRMLECLQAAGVSNLQVFPSEITVLPGKEVRTDYSVVNVVGLIACANPRKSEATPIADRHYFVSLHIDESKVGDLAMFRLAESQLDIIVSEKVAEALRRAKLTNLELEPVA